jgi:hypothetical protein
MRTVTLDIIDDKAINVLKGLESLNVIKLHDDVKNDVPATLDLASKYSGAMTRQTIEEIDKQLKDLRDEWN